MTPGNGAKRYARVPASRGARLAIGVLVAVAVALAVTWPLRDAIARARDGVVRQRALLDIARTRSAENAALERAPAVASGDRRAAIERVLAERGLRFARVEAQDGDGIRYVIESAPFDALVHALDALARDAHARVVEASLAGRVEPGTVRAELAFAR
ncbi:MAG: type II secretion system protein GspM [Rudaea sp.]